MGETMGRNQDRRHPMGLVSLVALVAFLAGGAPAGAGISYPTFAKTDGLFFVGSASSLEDRLQITPPATYLAGAVWHTVRQQVAKGFDTSFTLRITENQHSQPFGDGIAFVVQDSAVSRLGHWGAGIGYATQHDPKYRDIDYGIPNSLAVEFDTFDNDLPSFGVIDVGHGKYHVSVQTRGRFTNNSTTRFSLGHAVLPDSLTDGNPHTARIRYVPGRLEAYFDDLDQPLLSLELRLDQVLDLDFGCAWVGFTGSTGSAISRQQILSWTMESRPTGAGFTAWPMYRHDAQRTGRSRQPGPRSPVLAWQQPILGAYASPAVSQGGELCVNTSGHPLLGLSSGGVPKWTYGEAGASRCPPALGWSGTLFSATPTRGGTSVVALDGRGQSLWELPMDAEVQTAAVTDGDGRVYLGVGNKLVALTEQGEVAWSYPAATLIVSSPSLSLDGSVVYFGCDDHRLYAVSREGRLLWSTETPGGAIRSAPSVFRGGDIYLGTVSGMICRFGPDGTLLGGYRAPAEIIGSLALSGDGDVCAGAADGTLLILNSLLAPQATFKAPVPITTAPTLDAGGRIYFGAGPNLYCVGMDGRSKWTRSLPNEVLVSPVIAGQSLLLTGTSDQLLMFRERTGPPPTVWTLRRLWGKIREGSPASQLELDAMDMDGDGALTVADLLLMVKALATEDEA